MGDGVNDRTSEQRAQSPRLVEERRGECLNSCSLFSRLLLRAEERQDDDGAVPEDSGSDVMRSVARA